MTCYWPSLDMTLKNFQKLAHHICTSGSSSRSFLGRWRHHSVISTTYLLWNVPIDDVTPTPSHDELLSKVLPWCADWTADESLTGARSHGPISSKNHATLLMCEDNKKNTFFVADCWASVRGIDALFMRASILKEFHKYMTVKRSIFNLSDFLICWF